MSRGLLAVVLFGIPVPIIAALLVGFWLGKHSAPATRTTAEERVVPTTDHSVMLRDGPWGKIEFVPLSIEIPDEFLSTRLHESVEPQWTFVAYTRDRLVELLGSAGLNDRQRAELLDEKKWKAATNGIVIKPSREVVLSLSPASRATIYKALGQFVENPEQEQAFAIPVSDFEQQFRGLAAETMSLLRSALYTNRNLVRFADLSTVLNKISSQDEKRRLEKALSRRQTGLMRVYVRYHQWLKTQTWYTPSFPGWVPG